MREDDDAGRHGIWYITGHGLSPRGSCAAGKWVIAK